MKKIIVPQKMHSAAWNAQHEHAKTHGPAVGCLPGSPCSLDVGLEAALRWLSENPIVPTHKQVQDIAQSNVYYTSDVAKWIVEWQRRMFLAPELDIPDGVEDLMWSETLYAGDTGFHDAIPNINKAIVEAFHRGQESRKVMTTAKEIREGGEKVLDTIQAEAKGISSPRDHTEAIVGSAIVLAAAMLVEIAAQLAEFNERENGKS